jgi:hypothetical protein
MGKRLTLHLQQNTTLERVAAILDFFNNQETDLEQLAATCQLGVSVLQKLIFPFLRSSRRNRSIQTLGTFCPR